MKIYHIFAVTTLFLIQISFATDIIDTTSNFKLLVSRNFKTTFEQSLITNTEESDVVKNYMNRLRKARAKKARQMAKSGRQPILNTEHPEIVKDKMVSEFIKMIKSFQKGDFTSVKPLKLSAASFTYNADVLRVKKRVIVLKGKKKTVRNVFVVHSTLSWKHQCMTECSLDFTEERFVVFDNNGRLLSIETLNESQ